MSLLTLKDIGKIYVSEGNVAIGIRGVNLSFDKGEFVAITGKSGSGKSTLLNVISGMDTYEEGELYIDGSPTSHYLQPDWEEYRKQYISFIFQDYNIIESYTVLQNVELALMHIDDVKERRKRALELLNRVGLSDHIHHKGSKLSGGQKQRTVIARALAKDSPIILADEPTGNLDSATSAEIIELLKEVAKDKLLIVVTHNFEQVEQHATRHIRIFDGAVESDHVLRNTTVQKPSDTTSFDTSSTTKSNIKNGFILGCTIFKATPRLSFFLCVLLLIGTIGVYLATAMCGTEIANLFSDTTMFTHIDGRVVVTTRGNDNLNTETVQKLASETGASSYLRVDSLIDDHGVSINFDRKWLYLNISYGENVGVDIGRLPENSNEVLLYVPISFQPLLGKESITHPIIDIYDADISVVGIKYFIDNNISAKAIFTKEGFDVMTALRSVHESANFSLELKILHSEGITSLNLSSYDFQIDFETEDEIIYLNSQMLRKHGKLDEIKVNGSFLWRNYNYNNGKEANTTISVENDKFVYDSGANVSKSIKLSAKYLTKIIFQCMEDTYDQASLFYSNDREAKASAEKINDMGYIAVPSYTTYTPDPSETIFNTIGGIIMLVLWFVIISFIVTFLTLCSKRSLAAFKGDMAIMRSMGISVTVIKIGMYFRMLLSIVPSIVIVITAALILYRIPQVNGFLNYLYPWQYALIFTGMLILTYKITKGHINRLFGESVKKSLKGGEGK